MKQLGAWLLIAVFLVGCKSLVPEKEPALSANMPQTYEAPTGGDDESVYDDPISGFYDTLQYDTRYKGTDFYTYLSEQEANAWEREARHIFTVLKEKAHPMVEEFIDFEEMEENFLPMWRRRPF